MITHYTRTAIQAMMSARPRFRAKRGTRGSSIVEFALIAPLFLFLLIAIIELGLLFWANLTMQYAVAEGARHTISAALPLVGGQRNPDPNTVSRAVVRKIEDSSMGLYGRLDPVVSIRSGAQYGSSAMSGGQGDIVVLQLDCAWPILTPLLMPFFPGGKYRFSVAATMRGEAFPTRGSMASRNATNGSAQLTVWNATPTPQPP